MLGHDLEMACAKFQGDRFRINGEFDEKHALQFFLNICVSYYSDIFDCINRIQSMSVVSSKSG